MGISDYKQTRLSLRLRLNVPTRKKVPWITNVSILEYKGTRMQTYYQQNRDGHDS